MDQKTIDARIRGEQARTLGNIAAQETPPDQAFWLSFADAEGFRGVVIVHANDFVEALMRTHFLGINPGGEVQGMPIPAAQAAIIPDRWKNRVLTRDDCAKFDAEMEQASPTGAH